MQTLEVMPRIVVIVVMAIAIVRFGEAVQTFDITPQSEITGYVTGAVILQCASSDRTGTVLWIRDGQVVSQNTLVTWNPNRCFISGDQSQGEFFLTITDLVESDAGTFYCILSGDGGDAAIASPPSLVTVLPDPPQIFTIEPSDTTVVEGETTIFQCAVENKKGTIYWSQGAALISIDMLIQDKFADRFSLIGDHANGEYFLQINNTQISDDAGYRCFVSNSDGSATLMSDLAQLIVIPVTTMSITTSAASTLADVTTLAQVTTQQQTTRPTTSKPTTKAPTHAPPTQKPSTKTPPTTQGPVAPGSSYPLCSLTGNNMFEDELATIACRSLGGEPIANIEWSKDGEKFEPTHTSLFMNEIVSYISLNLTEDLLGAVFICTSSHVLYEEPKTCQVGPLEFELKQFIVEIEPAVLNARPGDEGMFECIVDSHYPVLDYVWRFEGEEINETDNRFKFDKNNTILHVLNITKDMDESEVTCEVTNTHENESASAIIRFGGHHRGLDALSVAIIAAIMTFVFIMIILVLILFYFFWWKKRKEKEIPSNQPVVEDGSSEVRKSTDSNLDGTISPKSGQANPAYVIESDIPLEKNGKLPAIRSHTPVGGRPNTADITYHRSEHKHSHRRHKKHKRKRIRPTEPKSPRSYDNGKPRVLDHFVVNSVDQETLLEKSNETGRDSPQNHVYETPLDAQAETHTPSRGRERSRKEVEEDNLRPRSPTPESHRPRTGERRHRHRRSVDEIDDRARESSERRNRHRRRRRHHDESEDETRKSGERRKRPKSSHRRSSSPENSDIGLRKPKKMPPINSGKAELEMKVHRTEESDIGTTEHDDDTKEVRKSHSKPRRHHRSRESHERRSSSSRDRHRSSIQDNSSDHNS